MFRATQRMISGVGAEVDAVSVSAGYTLRVLALAARYSIGTIFSRRGFGSVVSQMYFCGVKAVGVVSVVGLFVGMILALQLGVALRDYGGEATIGMAVSQALCREMGPIMTAIILTALVGSTIAAELGTMKVSEEIDALEVMAIDPVRLLATPRIIALTAMSFVLTVLVDLVGVLGGGVVAAVQLDVPFSVYLDYARDTLTGREFLGLLPKDVYSGLVKSLVFGATISSVACAQGLRAGGGALGVGRAVRRTVVTSIILILIFAYLMTTFFYA